MFMAQLSNDDVCPSNSLGGLLQVAAPPIPSHPAPSGVCRTILCLCWLTMAAFVVARRAPQKEKRRKRQASDNHWWLVASQSVLCPGQRQTEPCRRDTIPYVSIKRTHKPEDRALLFQIFVRFTGSFPIYFDCYRW